MPITINTQSFVYKEQYNFARTYVYDGLKPNLKGDIKVDFNEIKTQIKTPTRVNNVVQIRLLLGPYTKPATLNTSSTIKWRKKDTSFPAIYRKFTLTQKIKLPDNIPKIKKIISTDNQLNIQSVKIYSGRITVNFLLNTCLVYQPK
ncbi:hypothetical protein IMX26_02140 [Clostridium sp. 'deep sea']|uniref:hypothetical protein n=1 Tax=Clostridium sp. 'deep sea' TaxID=2779445 RepID=UPI0018967117|nr:hypothetical protein [Clostridium sp. 'deep sea']QOR35651.1 hypothetical protein IMX26_02140 [Clostridium sp. 'deep sea']